MAKRKPFALRIDETILAAMQRYADDELRSLNAQIEFVLREALRSRGRLPQPGANPNENPDEHNVQTTVQTTVQASTDKGEDERSGSESAGNPKES